MSDLTAVSLFAGVGGFDLALKRAGVKVVAAVEIDPACRGVLARHFPETHLFSDVTEVTGDQLRAAGFVPGRGILTGGFPCQDLSIAGRRAGLAGARSGLFWHIVRLAHELHPQWLVLENVPGLLSAVCSCPGDGTCTVNGRAVRCGEWRDVAESGTLRKRRRWFPDVPHGVKGGACHTGCMERHGGAMGTILGALGELGYGFAYRVLDAQFFGVPQRRERVFFAGCSGDPRGPVEVLLEPEGGAGNPAACGQARADVAGTLGSRVGGSRTTDLDGHGAYVTGALTAGSVGDYDDNTARAGFMITAPTITAGWGTNHGAPGHGGKDAAALAVTAATLQGGGQRGHRVDAEGAAGGHLVPVVSHAITARERKGADSDAVSGIIITHALTSEGFDASEDGTGRGTPIVPIGVPPMEVNAFNPQSGGSKARLGYGDKPTALQANQVTAVHEASAVRRLTPRECERLQGFPDDWTRHLADGTEQSDSARYRQCGNAVAVPVVQWIAERLVAVDSASAVPAETTPGAAA